MRVDPEGPQGVIEIKDYDLWKGGCERYWWRGPHLRLFFGHGDGLLMDGWCWLVSE